MQRSSRHLAKLEDAGSNPADLPFDPRERPLWRHIRAEMPPPALVAAAADRRSRGDWRGAAELMPVDVEVDLAAVRTRHGAEAAARVADDLHHLCLDLLWWHLPRHRGGRRTLQPRTAAVLAPRAGAAESPLLHLRLPKSPAGPQRVTLSVTTLPDLHRSRWYSAPRHTWDVRETGALAGHWHQPEVFALLRAGAFARAWQRCGIRLAFDDTPGGLECLQRPTASPTSPVGVRALAREAADAFGVDRVATTLAAYLTLERPFDTAEASDPHDWLDVPVRIPTGSVPPDLALIAAGLMTPEQLHPLILAATAPLLGFAGPRGQDQRAGADDASSTDTRGADTSAGTGSTHADTSSTDADTSSTSSTDADTSAAGPSDVGGAGTGIGGAHEAGMGNADGVGTGTGGANASAGKGGASAGKGGAGANAGGANTNAGGANTGGAGVCGAHDAGMGNAHGTGGANTGAGGTGGANTGKCPTLRDRTFPTYTPSTDMPHQPVFRVRCGREWHRLTITDGALRLPNHDEREQQREAALRALGGDSPGCFGVEQAWQRGGGRLPRALHEYRRTLMRRLQFGDTELLLRGLADGSIDPRMRAHNGWSLLHMALWLDERALPALLAAGVPVDVADRIGRTPMYEAVVHGGSARFIRGLFDAGADPRAETVHGTTPAHVARHYSDGRDLGFLAEK